ncbi:MAG: transposase [Candidatus Binatia bacterium]
MSLLKVKQRSGGNTSVSGVPKPLPLTPTLSPPEKRRLPKGGNALASKVPWTTILAFARPGCENLEDWKKLLRTLLERGLRRVLIVVQDDFSGLLTVTQSLFPQADVQLRIVHMQRNAKTHLGKAEATAFTQRRQAVAARDGVARVPCGRCDRWAPRVYLRGEWTGLAVPGKRWHN